MLYKVDEGRAVKPNGLEEGEHVHSIPAHGGINVPDPSSLKVFEEFAGHGMTYPNPHLAGMDPYHFNPTTLFKAEALTFDLADDETYDLAIPGSNIAHALLFAEAVLYHLDPLPGHFLLYDGLLDGNDLRDIFGPDLPRFDPLFHLSLTRSG